MRNVYSCSLVDVDVGKFKESLWVQLEIKNRIVLVGCIYRSPSSSTDNSQELCNLMSKVCAGKPDHLLIAGDFI